MEQALTSTQKELLRTLPADLSAVELQKLLALIKAFLSHKESDKLITVEENATAYIAGTENEDVVHLSFPKSWLNDAWLVKLMNWLEMKKLTDGSQMTEAQALEMGDQAKAEWWAKNQDWVLGKIGGSQRRGG